MRKWNFLNNGDTFRSTTEVVSRLLAGRGLEEEKEIHAFLHPRLKQLEDPRRLPDMEIAVCRIDKALREQESILIFSDYDVDGMSSGALMYRFLVAMGGKVEVLIPERFSEGYGLSSEALDRAMLETQPTLVLCLDCGTTSIKEVAELNARGIDVVILDHHELAQENPPAHAFVNPQRGDLDHNLATVGLVFKFIHAFLKILNQPDAFDLKEHLDLVALGTISDLVPLKGDNRILVHYGLRQMANTSNLGLRALMKVAGVKRKPVPSTVGFLIGPRLNASGRLTSAKEGWKLLTTREPQEARELAESLDALNRERQKVETEVFLEARKLVEDQPDEEKAACIVVSSDRWHQGVIGIVASRLQRIWYRPTIVVSVDENGCGKGSGRSIRGCSLMDALRDCSGHLETFGGHAMAAGLEINESGIVDFRRAINEWFQANISQDVFQETLDIEMDLPGELLSEDLAREVTRMEPFGQNNLSPVFAVKSVEVCGRPRFFGKSHVRFRAEISGARFDVVAFGKCPDGKLPADVLDLAGHWEVDDFTGQPCFRVVDWRC